MVSWELGVGPNATTLSCDKKSIVAMRNSKFNSDTEFTKSILRKGNQAKGLWWAEAIAIQELFSVNE